MLEDHPDPAADLAQFFLRGGGDVYVIPYHAPFGGLDQAVDTAQQGRFPGAAEADDHQELAVGHLNADIFQSKRAAFVDLGEMFYFEHSDSPTRHLFEPDF